MRQEFSYPLNIDCNEFLVNGCSGSFAGSPSLLPYPKMRVPRTRPHETETAIMVRLPLQIDTLASTGVNDKELVQADRNVTSMWCYSRESRQFEWHGEGKSPHADLISTLNASCADQVMAINFGTNRWFCVVFGNDDIAWLKGDNLSEALKKNRYAW